MASGVYSLCPTVTSLFSSHALVPTLQCCSSSNSRSPPLRISRALSVATVPTITISPSSSSSFTWDDVFENNRADYEPQNSSDLTGFLEKIDRCNRGYENLAEFIPLVIEEQIVGYVHKGFTKYLREFHDIFTFSQYRGHVTLNMMFESLKKEPEQFHM